jgi:cellulose synthase/poly-beta-1,6-N-acetylglucosamine synthase-like glycosyltransferase
LTKIKHHSYSTDRKRQWGSERRTTPLSTLHEVPSTAKIAFSRVAIVLTVLFWLVYISSTIVKQLIDGPKSYNFTMEAFSYLIVMSVLTFSALMYLIARQGALQRFSKHLRVPRAVLEKHFVNNQSSITVLVPSYSEEPEVIRKTLLSAALQEYPNMRVVLLLDDNPNPKNPEDLKKLQATRALGSEIQKLFSEPNQRFTGALSAFESNFKNKSVTKGIIQDLIAQYSWAAMWLNTLANKEKIEDHVDVFFSEQVLRELSNDLSLVADALAASYKEGVLLSKERVHLLYNRLVWIFNVEVEVFERKQYASLSHEANKAMNLNAYIGIMGKSFREEITPDGKVLVEVNKKTAGSITIPDSEFLLTLDADSILLRDYCLRLIYFLQQPDNADVAVTQTPYSSFRGAFSRIERLSGATTDIQHILHQGMSYYGATFWVGANAVIRKKAIEDIVQKEWVGGFEVSRFIQDRTVIEDTESSIDLALHGWRLVNYPERLSYSATPPDFGSLVVQRRRWANGGLLILPKLWTQIRERKRKNEIISRTEILLRLNYMASITWSTFGLIFLLAYPYDGRLLSPLVLLAAIPYFLAMASDLKYSGYRYTDIFRIYGFNLILLPVNLAGVLKSLQQAITGKKIPFARTPKVKNRTAAALPYVIAPLLIIGFSVFTLWRNIEGENWGNAAFAGFNVLASVWALIAYIGIFNVVTDIWMGITQWLYVEVKPKSVKKETIKKPALDWRVVLYHGEKQGTIPHTSLHELVTSKERGAMA